MPRTNFLTFANSAGSDQQSRLIECIEVDFVHACMHVHAHLFFAHEALSERLLPRFS